VRQLWSGETREAGQVAGFPHQVPFGPAVAQQGAGVLAAKMLENIKTRKKVSSNKARHPNPLKSGLPLQVRHFGGGHGGDVQEG